MKFLHKEPLLMCSLNLFFWTIFALLEAECQSFLISRLAWYTLYVNKKIIIASLWFCRQDFLFDFSPQLVRNPSFTGQLCKGLKYINIWNLTQFRTTLMNISVCEKSVYVWRISLDIEQRGPKTTWQRVNSYVFTLNCTNAKDGFGLFYTDIEAHVFARIPQTNAIFLSDHLLMISSLGAQGT